VGGGVGLDGMTLFLLDGVDVLVDHLVGVDGVGNFESLFED
jgi:hypothetical protein